MKVKTKTKSARQLCVNAGADCGCIDKCMYGNESIEADNKRHFYLSLIQQMDLLVKAYMMFMATDNTWRWSKKVRENGNEVVVEYFSNVDKPCIMRYSLNKMVNAEDRFKEVYTIRKLPSFSYAFENRATFQEVVTHLRSLIAQQVAASHSPTKF